MSESNPALDLSTDRPRTIIAIDGQQYKLALPDDFGFAELTWMQHAGKRITALSGVEEISEEDAAYVEKSLDRLLHKIVSGAGEKILGRLSIRQKMQVVELFIKAAGTTTSPRPGATSPGSADSTADPGKNGPASPSA